MSETAEAAVPSPQPTSEAAATKNGTTTTPATTTETLATGTTGAVAEPANDPVETVSEATEMDVETAGETAAGEEAAGETTTETMPKTVPETSKESGKSSRKRNRSPSPPTTTTAADATGTTTTAATTTATTTTTTTTLDGNGMTESGKEEEAVEEPSRKKKKMVDATAKPIPSSSLTTTTEAAGAAAAAAAAAAEAITTATTTAAEPAVTDMEIGEEMTEEEKAASLEIQDAFTTAATKLLDEKLAVLDAESTMIEEGTHDEFVGQVSKYKKARDEKVKLAEAWRNLQMENINNVYQAEIAEAETHYASFQNTIRKTMLDAIAEKRKSIEEEKAIHMGDAQKSSSVRTLRKRGAKGGDGAGGKGNDAAQDGGLNSQGVGAPGSLRNQFPPGISRGASYALQENDIREDLYLIQKSIYGRSGPTGYPSVPTPMVTSTTSTTQ